MSDARFILTLECPDAVGIVAAVATFLADRDYSIEESDQFHEAEGEAFFMRTAFSAPAQLTPNLGELEAGFAPIARRFGMKWRIHDKRDWPKVVVAVSKIGHCLQDLLHRQESDWLDADIAAVVSNHADFEAYCRWRQTPFHVLPKEKTAAEARILEVMDETEAELLVLARYMQILSPDACAKLEGRCINIHHSFLPSFKGARPYHQAFERGVKIIGATAHYVTSDLDEGPIIEQGVERVAHHHTPRDLIEIGRDLECQVLARAVRWHVERRVVISGAKTVVFR